MSISELFRFNKKESQDQNCKKDLNAIFKPRGVAVVGASSTPGKVGYQILKNIIDCGYEGEIYPINPKDDEVLGKKAYKTVEEVPGDVDVAVISIPAPLVIQTLEGCARKGVKGVAVITSGFGEVGNVEDELQLKKVADKNNIALLGPNMFGYVYTPSKLNASFGPADILPGKIAFISQSGALAISLMGWTAMEKIGLASLVNLGNKADIDEKDLIEYFNNDDNVDAILIYMEGIKEGRKFLETEIKKPVVILKVGSSTRGAKAAASHTGSLSGSDKIYEGVFKQLGLLRAKTFTQAFDWARAFSLSLPKGDETIIITNGGGIGVATTDECESQGIKLIDDSKWLEEKFRKTMPDFGSTKNPIDITGGSGMKGYQESTRIALQEDRIKSVIILYCETAVTNPIDIAKTIVEEYKKVNRNKPVLVAMVGGIRTTEALHYLNDNHIPAFSEVSDAVSSLRALYKWQEISGRKKEIPKIEPAPQEVVDMIEKIKGVGRSILLEHEARKVLELCGVPTPKWGFARNIDEAIDQAKDMYPLAMKITSPEIIHKSDVGGVVVNIRNEQQLKEKFDKMMNNVSAAMPDANILGVNIIQMVEGIECIVGMSNDPQFGPVVMFGLGGVFVEALKDVSFRIVPFGKMEAGRLLNDIKAKKILDGFRGVEAHKPSIIQTIYSIQRLAPLVKEIDINPLITNKDGSFAVDARIIL
ncbi:MAG: acetate--CoA ligase family protein [Candidatus Omnitrophica bacterium]|nr:acetate--CoA ligase family protein [Candidatus Omnitrophota bacterium]